MARLYMSPWKMLLFLVVGFGILVILEYYSGFQPFEQVSPSRRPAMPLWPTALGS